MPSDERDWLYVFGPENYIQKWEYTIAVGLQGNDRNWC